MSIKKFTVGNISFLLILSLVCMACENKGRQAGENILAEIDGVFLYTEDLQSALPAGLTPDDSLLFAENYIRNWAEDILLFDIAQENIRDNEAVEKLVQNYRKSLIVHAYQQELINQRLSSNVPEDEIARFYEENKELFVVKRPLIKGLFIKVPLNAPQLNDLRKWYRTETYEAVEKLEKYSLLNAVSYDYFYDRWTPVIEILGKMPLKEANPEQYINRNRNIELQDTAFHYFLNVTDYLKPGDQEPYDFARTEAKDMVVNTKKIDFMKNMKNEIYNDALRKNKIKLNY